jgi:hypothetical protein
VFAGFASGAVLGLGFHRETFWGGYASPRRRLARLGHVACVALGVLNLLFAQQVGADLVGAPRAAGGLLVAGSIAMPLVCFLCAWRVRFRALFAVPVAALFASILLVLHGFLP